MKIKYKYKYIKRLNEYNDIKIHLIFRKNNITDQKTKEKILKIFEGTKEEIQNNFHVLKNLGVINGIGSSKFGQLSIIILSYLLKGVKYEWHDIMYFIGGSLYDKIYADYGLLKHTILNSLGLFNIVYKFDLNPILKLCLYIFTIFAVIFYIGLGIISFLTVLTFGTFAFNFIKYK